MLANMNGEVNGNGEESRETSPIKDSDPEPIVQKEITVQNHENVHSEDNGLPSETNHSDNGVEQSPNSEHLKNGHQNDESENISGNESYEPKQCSKSPENPNKISEDQSPGKQSSGEQSDKNNKETSKETTTLNEKMDTNDNPCDEDPIRLSDIEKDDNEDSDDIEDYPVANFSDLEPVVQDNISLDSDSSNSSQGGHDKSSDVIILENDDDSEVHEIESDNDCVVTQATIITPTKKTKKKMEPTRRSSRTPKRVKYDDYDENETESDVELVAEDPLKRKSKPIVNKDSKKLFDIPAKQGKNQKKEARSLIIDSQKSNSPTKNSTQSASYYQSIVGRGTTVTAVTCKSSGSSALGSQTTTAIPSTPIQPQPQPNILPSLTDDMLVVEAPSFIVPYVYEKPSMKPFREFVDELGKQLEEEKAKEEKEKLEKKKEEKAKREKEKKERNETKERGEEEVGSDEEKDEAGSQDSTKVQEEQDPKKIKAEKKERRRRKKEEEDDSWDESESEESDDETISDEEGTTVVLLKDKVDTIEEIKHVTEITSNDVAVKSDNYFDCSLGKFFMDIGINLVKEYVQTDLLKQQNRKLQREKKSGQNTRERQVTIAMLMKNLELSKENNSSYKHPLKKCQFCSFKTESKLVMENHLQIPHMKNNLYKCNFCEFQIKSPHDIIFHMEAEHNIKGKLERAPSYHECVNCPFEDNGKGKLARHLIACVKKFKPDHNLAPPLEWEPPAKIPKLAKARQGITGQYANSFGRPTLGRPPMPTLTNMGIQGGYKPRARVPAAPARGLSIAGSHVVRAGITPVRPPTPVNYAPIKGKSMQHPSISITPLPRQPTPIPIQSLTQNAKGTFVICEICDGYIKDLEQLRNHMQWIHKVKIHPKMIYNRPPLNCQKCQFRFFTDQGLERHLLGSHGLVTSSMQEAANKGKDAGRCPVCGRVYQWKLLNHVSRDHNLTLKPAHLSYKCTVCTATFGMYKQFENHVYSAHSVVAKRVMDKNKPAAKPADTSTKPLKINDEITITPQPASASKSK